MNIEKNIAIIILNYNNYELTRKLVRNLKDIGYIGNIVIVDNASKNQSFKILKEEVRDEDKNIYVVQSDKNGGYAYGNNIGIRYILEKKGNIEYIAIANPDIELDKNFSMNKIIDKISNRDDIAGISPMQIYNKEYNPKFFIWDTPNFTKLMVCNLGLVRRVVEFINNKDYIVDVKDSSLVYTGAMPGSFFIMKRDIFEKIEFFDENTFLYFEENILGLKIKEAGYKVCTCINQYYLHDHSEKKNDLKNLKSKINDSKYFMKSEEYYIKNYLKKGFMHNIIFKIISKFHIYVEIPIIHYMRKFIKWIL